MFSEKYKFIKWRSQNNKENLWRGLNRKIVKRFKKETSQENANITGIYTFSKHKKNQFLL